MPAHAQDNAEAAGQPRILERVCTILSQYSGAPAASIGPSSTPQNTPGWDSVANLNLIAAIEEEFGVTVGTRDAMKLRSVGDIVAFLDGRRSGGSTG